MSGDAWKVRKQTKDSLAASDEASLRQGIKLRLKAQRIRALLGKKAPPDVRGNAYADDAIFLKIQRALRSGATVRLTDRKVAGVLVEGDIRSPPKDIGDILLSDEYEDEVSIYVPLWKHTGDKLKTLAWIMAMEVHGPRARALSLNIGPDVIGMAQWAQEKRGVGFARFLRDRMTKHLKKALRPFGLDAPEFFIWVEADRTGKEHAHGVIVIPDHSAPTKVMKAIRAALKSAGGRWNPAEHENQVRLKRIHDPMGWAGYVTKWKNLTRLRIQSESTVAASGGIRSRARAWYDEMRRSGVPINNGPRHPWALGSTASPSPGRSETP